MGPGQLGPHVSPCPSLALARSPPQGGAWCLRLPHSWLRPRTGPGCQSLPDPMGSPCHPQPHRDQTAFESPWPWKCLLTTYSFIPSVIKVKVGFFLTLTLPRRKPSLPIQSSCSQDFCPLSQFALNSILQTELWISCHTESSKYFFIISRH